MHGTNPEEAASASSLKYEDETKRKSNSAASYGRILRETVRSRRIGFDALSGTTPDGKIVSYGYLTNGQITASYLDGGNFPRDTIIAAENKGIPVNPPGGITDPNPDGDNNYNVTGTSQGWLGGAIFWNFLGKHPQK
jgi:hypothetical protein